MLPKSQSMTLLLMMDFFNENGISPTESIGPNMENLEKRLSLLFKKRMNGIIAIMKNIEKNQTKPTVAMLQSRFEQAEPQKQKLMIEKNTPIKRNKCPLVKSKFQIFINNGEGQLHCTVKCYVRLFS